MCRRCSAGWARSSTSARSCPWPLLAPGLSACVLAASVVAFYVFGRYRFPLVPLLLPFAALGAVELVQLARGGQWRALLGPGILAACALTLSHLPLLDESSLRSTAHLNMGNVLLRDGRMEEALLQLRRAEVYHEPSPDLHFHYATLYLRVGRPKDAERHLARMIELDESDFRGHSLMGTALRRQGRGDEAVPYIRRALQLNPEPGRHARDHGREGWRRERRNRAEQRAEQAP